MESQDLYKLLEVVASADINELCLETGDYKLSIKRGAPEPVVVQQNPPVVTTAPTPTLTTTPTIAPVEATPQTSESSEAPNTTPSNVNLIEVTAPIVGTFYAAPGPDTPPFVKEGDKVSAGAVLCIIEAMKLMNEIEAEVSGTIAEILVRNEEPVEYGQVLFTIDPS